MPNSRHSEAMLSPSLSRITNRIRSSITELSFHGIPLLPPPFRRKSVTHVSGTFCYLCLGSLIKADSHEHPGLIAVGMPDCQKGWKSSGMPTCYTESPAPKTIPYLLRRLSSRRSFTDSSAQRRHGRGRMPRRRAEFAHHETGHGRRYIESSSG